MCPCVMFVPKWLCLQSKPQETKGSIPVKKLNVEIPTATRKAEEEVKVCDGVAETVVTCAVFTPFMA